MILYRIRDPDFSDDIVVFIIRSMNDAIYNSLSFFTTLVWFEIDQI